MSETLSITALLQNTLGAHTQIGPEAHEFLMEHFKERHYSQGEFLAEAGSIAKYFYFVLSGVQALYLINQKGEKVILGFSYEGNPSGVYASFINQQPSPFFMEALTDSSLIAITKEKYDELFDRFPEFLQWRVHFIEGILFGRGSREVEMLTKSAKERFDAFIDRCPPQLFQIPQKYLASYLHMKPETFSRLRSIRD